MLQIPLQNIATQSLSFQDYDTQTNYDIFVKTCGFDDAQIMSFDIAINDVVVVSGCRAVAGFPLLASEYQVNGNFVVITANDDLPAFQRFGIDQFLIYANQNEINAIAAAQATTLTDIEDLT